MTNTIEIHHRERLGWAFLIIAFAVFLAIAISVPLFIRAYLQNATQLLPTLVQANQGTVRIDDQTGLMRATLSGEPADTVEPGAEILTDVTATALLTVFPPDSEQILSRIQVYGNSTVRLDTLDAPRFKSSSAVNMIELTLEGGRLRLSVPETEGRPFTIIVNTPQGVITIDEAGQYSLEVSNTQTQIAVQSGEAAVSGQEQLLALTADQRAIIPNESPPTGPLGPERDLIRNGDFNDSFNEWNLFTWNVELADQPDGEISVLPIGGEPTLHIKREGEGHADVRLRQTINQDVTDYESLQLFLTLRIVEQNLDVCGLVGSECPLFIRVNYRDENGISHTWQHGFYGQGEVVAGSAPDACVSCDVVQSSHQILQLGQVYFYEVDLRADLSRQGFLPPSFIENVAIVSSGHSFEVEILDVALMAKE